MSRKWKTVRIPADLAGRLDRLARRLEQAHDDGRTRLPSEYVERVPIHHVIDRAVADFEAHLQRAAKPRRGARSVGISDPTPRS